MRLRQICVAARHLEPTLSALATLFDSPVMYRDPNIAYFGLANGLVMTGGDFIEVVSPLPDRDDAAAGRHLARHGDSFYMAIFQCADAASVSAHIKSAGVRAVFAHAGDGDGVHATHFHPGDFGGAIVSVDSMGRDDWHTPQAYWKWAEWPPIDAPHPNTDTPVGAIAGLTLAAPDPTGLCAHWAALLQRPVIDTHISLDGSALSFVEGGPVKGEAVKGGGGAPRVTDIQLHRGRDGVADICARARSLDLPVDDNRVQFCGLTWHFHD